jgi:hypothetical protein
MCKILHTHELDLYYKIRMIELMKVQDAIRLDYQIPIEAFPILIQRHNVLQDENVVKFRQELDTMLATSGNAYLATEARQLLVFSDVILIQDGLLSFQTVKAIWTLLYEVVTTRLEQLMIDLDVQRKLAYDKQDWDTYERIAMECSTAKFNLKHEALSYLLFKI